MAFHALGTFFLAKSIFMQDIQLQPGSHVSKTNKQQKIQIINLKINSHFPVLLGIRRQINSILYMLEKNILT